ncbi:MAG TPA: tetratricopeptide repeat protein [Candidatus Dormibacteraeota bacterium]|jgi:TPR repeat protein|nr:tetratricopeptide repeat protein [Candidatus Dormibacteraeota bacterium]
MTKTVIAALFLYTAVNLAVAQQQQGKSDVCPSEAKDFTAIQQRADANDPTAQAALASCYDMGMHVKPDGKESIGWLTKAANQGYAPAEYELGRIYLYGRGIEADYSQALLWERKAAEQGDPRAQRDLAFMYERGFGVPADPAQAAEWNRKAATQGNAEAQFHLAKALDEGAGVRKDPDEAREWYGEAAAREQPTAQLELARKFARVPACAEAIHWYKEAASHGVSAAMYELANFYLNTKCGADRNRAFIWFTISGRFGAKEGKAEAERLARTLTPAQRKSANLIAERWIKEHPGADKDEEKEEL